MTEQRAAADGMAQDRISFAELSGGVVVIRVAGRGSFANSVELKKLTDHLAETYGPGEYHFIVDLGECPTMDSTFMGVLASVGLRQKRDGLDLLTVVNATEHARRLMQTLGLTHFMDIRGADHDIQKSVGQGQFQTARPEQVSDFGRIIHMIEAHEQLCDADTENAVRFRDVLKYLHESLDREKGK
jgi:anti-anti-sigma factor